MEALRQGAGSSELKFRAGLCQPCNNSRSKPFDHLHEHFARACTSGLSFGEYLGDTTLGMYTKKWVPEVRSVDAATPDGSGEGV